MERIKTPKWFWLGWGLVAAGWEYRSLKKNDGATFSETTRATMFTHTRAGKVAFIAGCAFLVAWFPRHILNQVERSINLVAGPEDEF